MVNYEIVEHIAVLNEGKHGERLELNRISWNGNRDKWDLRRWGVDENGNRIAFKGVAMTDSEWEHLRKIMMG